MATSQLLTDREKLNQVLREIYKNYGQNLGEFLRNLPDKPSAQVVGEKSPSVLKKE